MADERLQTLPSARPRVPIAIAGKSRSGAPLALRILINSLFSYRAWPVAQHLPHPTYEDLRKLPIMSAQMAPKRKRLKAGITRVRTGCYTCRRRKVKVRDAGERRRRA